MNEPKDYIAERPDEENETWTDEDQDALDDYNQAMEDLAMEE